MSSAPDKRAGQPPQAAASPPPAGTQGGSPFSNLVSGGKQSNKNLFILLGVAGALLFFCLTFALIYSLVGGRGSKTAGPGGPMFPEDGKGGTPGLRLPPSAGVVALKPRDAANGFLRDLRDDHVEDAYRRTSRLFQLGQTPEQFRQMVDMKRALRYYTSYELRPTMPESGNVVRYEGKVTGGPYGTVEFNIEVVKEENGWVIREFHPE
jgi:hypothetical protein